MSTLVSNSQKSSITSFTAPLSVITSCAQGLLTKIQQGSLDEVHDFAAFLIDQFRNQLFHLHHEEKVDNLYGIIPILFEALCHPHISHQDFHKYIIAKALRHCIEAVFLVAHQEHNLISETNRQDVLQRLETLQEQTEKEEKPGQTGLFFEIDYSTQLLRAFESPESLVDINSVFDAIKEVATDHKIGSAIELVKQLWKKKVKGWFVPTLTLSWMGAVVLKNPDILPLLQQEITQAFQKKIHLHNKDELKNIRLSVVDIFYEIICFGSPEIQEKALLGESGKMGLKDLISQSPKEVRCRALELVSQLRNHPSPHISSKAHQIYQQSPQKTDDKKIQAIFKESLPMGKITTTIPTWETLDKRLEDSKDRVLASINLQLTEIQIVFDTVLQSNSKIKEKDHPIHQEFLKAARTCDQELLISSLKGGAHIDVKDEEGNNALHLLILNVSNVKEPLENLIEILLKKKIDLQAQNNQKKTAFNLALEQNVSWPVFKAILEASSATSKKSLLKETFYEYALKSFMPSELPDFIRYYVKHLISLNPSFDTHKKYYTQLPSQASLEPLRRVYLNTLQENNLNEGAQKLSEIPNRFGLRQSYLIAHENFMRMVSRITTKKPNDYEITIPSLGKLYLKPKIAKKILTKDGHIQKHYQNGLHNVAKYKGSDYDLHFKEAPIHPLMEYAVGNFLSRIMGKATPCTAHAFTHNFLILAYL